MAQDVEKLIVQMSADIRAFQKEMAKVNGITAKAFRDIEKNARAADKNLDRMLTRTAEKLGNNLRTPLTGLAGLLGTRELMKYADNWTRMGNLVAASAKSTGIQARSLSDLRKEADDARSAIEPYVELYARIMRSAGGVASSENEIAQATNIVSKAFVAGGAAASEQAAAVLQLGQALGSGFLQGDELRSIRENAPLLAQAIADEFGVTIAGLKDLGAKGELTSERVFRAILNAQKKIEAQFNVTNATMENGMTRIKNAMMEYIGTGAQASGVSKSITAGLNIMADNFDKVADVALQLAGVIAGVLVGRSLTGMIRTLGLVGPALTKFIDLLKTARKLADIGGAFSSLGRIAGPLGAIVGGGLALAIGLYAKNAIEASKRTEEINKILKELGVIAQDTSEKAKSSMDEISKSADLAVDRITKLQDAYKELKRKSESLFSTPSERKKVIDDMEKLNESLKRLGATTGTTNESFNEFVTGIQNYLSDNYIDQSTFDQFIAVLNKVKSGGMDAARAIAEFQKTASGDIRLEKLIQYSGILKAIRDEAEQVGKVFYGPVVPSGMKFTGIEEENEKAKEAMKVWDALDKKLDEVNSRTQKQIDLEKERAENAKELGEDLIKYIPKEEQDRRAQRNIDLREAANPKKDKTNEYERLTKQINQRIEAIKAETEVQRNLNPFVNDYGFALEKLRTYQELLNAAKAAGLKIDTDTMQAMEQLASRMAEAQTASARVAEQQEKLREKLEEVKDVSHDVTRTFIDSMIEGKNATEALGDAISRLGQRLLDAGLDALFDNIFKVGSNNGGWLGKMFGFSSGGYTGSGGKYQPAGMVHKGEVVWSQDDVKRWGGPQVVDAMRKGYASGGIVGPAAIPQMPYFPSAQELRAMADRSQATQIKVDVTPSPYFDVRVTEISRQETASGVKEYDKGLNKTIGIKMSNARNLNRSGF